MSNALVEKFTIIHTRMFVDDLRRLPDAIYKKANRVIDRMLVNPWAKELHPEKIKQAEDGVYSCRVDDNYRIIWKHIKPNDIVFWMIDAHDDAYNRTTRKRFRLDDGMVRIVDVVEEAAQHNAQRSTDLDWLIQQKQQTHTPGKLFLGYQDDELRKLGVPENWLPHVRVMDDLNDLQLLEEKLDPTVFDALLSASIHTEPTVPDKALHQSLKRYQGGDDLHRFVDSDEFKRALAGDMQDWMIFLAPHQRRLVAANYNGPARIKGVAGSGKTVVAIHRAYRLYGLANDKGVRVLYLTYGNRLPGITRQLLQRLAGDKLVDDNFLECTTLHKWCSAFLRGHGISLNTIDPRNQRTKIEAAIESVKPRYTDLAIWKQSHYFFADEIKIAIKGRAIKTRDDYLKLDRSGRGTPLQGRERHAMYDVYEQYQQALHADGLCDFEDFILESLRLLEENPDLQGQYRAAVIDEIQDFTEAAMRLMRLIVTEGQNDLFLVGDGLQRIYPGGYSLSGLDINIVGRSHILQRNYRNTAQILRAAHIMIKDQSTFDDMDDTQSDLVEPEYSVRQGEIPILKQCASLNDEIAWIDTEIDRLCREEGYQPHDMAFLYRIRRDYEDALRNRFASRLGLQKVTDSPDTFFGQHAKYTTFHSAKGLEFKVVFIVGVSDGLVPFKNWNLEGEALAEHLRIERQLLYVAMTRARDRLYLTCHGQPSEFLQHISHEVLQRA